MNLSQLAIGKDAVISSVETRDVALRKHILEMGLTPGVEVSLLKSAPLGDPIEIRVRGYSLTIRRSEAENIEVEGIHESHDDEDEEHGRGRLHHSSSFLSIVGVYFLFVKWKYSDESANPTARPATPQAS